MKLLIFLFLLGAFAVPSFAANKAIKCRAVCQLPDTGDMYATGDFLCKTPDSKIFWVHKTKGVEVDGRYCYPFYTQRVRGSNIEKACKKRWRAAGKKYRRSYVKSWWFTRTFSRDKFCVNP